MPIGDDERVALVEEMEATLKAIEDASETILASHGSALQVDELMDLTEGDLVQPLYHALKDAPKIKNLTGNGYLMKYFGAKGADKADAAKKLVAKLNSLANALDVRGVLAIGGIQIVNPTGMGYEYVAFAFLGVSPETASFVDHATFNPETLEGV